MTWNFLDNLVPVSKNSPLAIDLKTQLGQEPSQVTVGEYQALFLDVAPKTFPRTAVYVIPIHNNRTLQIVVAAIPSSQLPNQGNTAMDYLFSVAHQMVCSLQLLPMQQKGITFNYFLIPSC